MPTLTSGQLDHYRENGYILVEDLLDRTPKLLLDHLARNRRLKPLDAILKHSQLVERRLCASTSTARGVSAWARGGELLDSVD